jgi:hypothetical protein
METQGRKWGHLIKEEGGGQSAQDTLVPFLKRL